MTRRILLGPQRLRPIVGDAARDLRLPGPVAVITAGWQEREAEDTELKAALAHPAFNLELYARWEEVQAADPEYFEQHRARQDRLRQLQRMYRLRLDPLMVAIRELLDDGDDPALLEPERVHAFELVRALDDHHLGRVQAELEAFDAGDWRRRPAIAKHRAAVAEALRGASAIAIAGGHVAVLLNRLRLLLDRDDLRRLPIIAWSAGAMALTDRVVLFHDDPPQGAGWAELLEPGLGLAPGLVLLPHARHRLHLDDPRRIALLARRFAPARCVPLDEGDRLDGPEFAAGRALLPDGGVRGPRPAGPDPDFRPPEDPLAADAIAAV